MNHLILYNRPKRLGKPPLQLVGVLDGYETGQAYSGRLQILNQIGDCTAWLHKGQLPPGAVIWVDNPAREVVVEWPAYEPPPLPRPNLPPAPPPVPPRGLFNGDFEQGTKGWRLGPGWWLKDTPGHGVLGTAALACTFHGTSFAESDPVACEPGTSISAEALWYQGASNKRNVDLYTQLVWRDVAMREIGVASGNKVHNMDNRRSHWSRVTANAPAGTAYASVRLLMHRRRYAREVVVDSVNWTHHMHSPVTVPVQPAPPEAPLPPAPDPYLDTYCITIRCRDAAGREADWVGCIGEKLIYWTSLLYPQYVSDALLSAGDIKSIHTLGAPIDYLDASGKIQEITLRKVTRGYDYCDDFNVNGSIQNVQIKTTIAYGSYNAAPESAVVRGLIQAVTLEVTIEYVDYDRYPVESISANGAIQGVSFK